MQWAELSIKATHESAERIAELFIDCGAAGVEIEDPALVNNYIESGAWDYTDIPLQDNPDIVEVKAWIAQTQDLPIIIENIRIQLSNIQEFFSTSIGALAISNIQDEDWENNWKEFFHTERIGKRIVVKPSWEEYEPDGDDIVITLDPGMAFGTGTHATTSMCIRLLEKYIKPELHQRIFDIGTGSGILAIAASKLGAQEVIAADYDPVAVRVATDNIIDNDLSIRTFQSDLLTSFDGKADFMIANIIADIILRLFNDVEENINPGGMIMTSGIIEERAPEIIAKAQECNFQLEERLDLKGWTAMVFKYQG